MTETTRTTDTTSVDSEQEHAHTHDHAAEQRAHTLSMQCWRLGQKARGADDWRRAVEVGREATELVPAAPEPRFNLAVALMGLARAAEDAEARLAAAGTFDEGRRVAEAAGTAGYDATAVALLEKRAAEFAGEPALQYALGIHLAGLGRAIRARRALEAVANDPTLAEVASAALAAAPEPEIRRAPPVGRNDPCPCGSGKKYKRCHGA